MTDEQPVDVQIDVDHEGHLSVVADNQEWVPPGPEGVAPEVRLGRSDLPWVLDQLLTQYGRPLDVVLRDGGRTFTDLVVPEHLKHGNPSFAAAPPGYAPDRHTAPMAGYQRAVSQDEPAPPPPPTAPAPSSCRGSGWFEAGGYAPGEQVAVAVIVTRVTADDHGRICLILPAALRPLVGDAVAIGEESREIYVNQVGMRFPGKDTWLAAVNEGTPTPPEPASPRDGLDLNLGFRRPAGGPDVGM